MYQIPKVSIKYLIHKIKYNYISKIENSAIEFPNNFVPNGVTTKNLQMRNV